MKRKLIPFKKRPEVKAECSCCGVIDRHTLPIGTSERDRRSCETISALTEILAAVHGSKEGHAVRVTAR